MTTDSPIVDSDAHEQRVALDREIRELTDHLAEVARTDRTAYAAERRKLIDLQAQRRDAYRREVGWNQ